MQSKMDSPSPRSTNRAFNERRLNASGWETDWPKLCEVLGEVLNVGQASRLTPGVSPVGERRDTPCAPSEDRRDACPTLKILVGRFLLFTLGDPQHTVDWKFVHNCLPSPGWPEHLDGVHLRSVAETKVEGQ